MAAPPDNRFWELRKKIGRDKMFSAPEELWEAACEYFDWCDDNPWYKTEQLKKAVVFIDPDTEKTVVQATIDIATARPYTVEGLCLHMAIDKKTFDNYGKTSGYEVFFPIVTRIREVIYNQKFEGAAVGAFNPSIIARDLGLADRSSVEVTPPQKPDWMGFIQGAEDERPNE